MKNCTDCKHALWERTEAGKLHPSGDGKCQYPWKMPELPAAMYFVSQPTTSGGIVNRKHNNAKHCAYYEA